MSRTVILVCIATALVACDGQESELRAENLPFAITEVAQFDEPWAMDFLPDGRALVTEKRGALKLLGLDGGIKNVAGVPEVRYGGQGGFGDIVVDPEFADNGLIYFNYAEEGPDRTRGAAVTRAQLSLKSDPYELTGIEVIWRQEPKVKGGGHFGHRIVFGPKGYLWITSGERQKFDPSQDMETNLGKIIRLNTDGSVPGDNPFSDRGGVTAQIWSLGHRNPLGIAFNDTGRLWSVEMGPRGGDELNLVIRGANYGYPIVSNGRHYSGLPIPDHDTRPEFEAPAITWTPVISPSSLIFYNGSEFPEWQNDAFIGGLTAMSLVRVEIDGDIAREAERFRMGRRIRSVVQGPDGALWILEDGSGKSGGRLLRLTARKCANRRRQLMQAGHSLLRAVC